MSKYNVLFVSATSEIGGADLALLDIVRQIDKSRFNPVITMPFHGPLIDDFKSCGAEVIICNTGYIRRQANPLKAVFNILSIIGALPRLVLLIKSKKINVVHSNSSIVFGGALAAKLSGVRHIWHVREVKVRPRVITAVIKWFIVHTSDRIIAISQAVKNSFSFFRSYQDKIIVLFDGVDLETFYPREEDLKLKKTLGIPMDSKVVAAMGLILPLKGYEYFLEAAGIVLKKFGETFFLIIGDTVINRHDAYKESLKKLTLQLELSDRVIFTGMRPDIAEILSFVNISVLASVEPEGLGRVIIEAMAMAKPVITTYIGGQVEAVIDNVDGLLVPPRNSIKLAQAIINLLIDDEKAKRLGAAGRRKSAQLFDLTKTVTSLENILENIILVSSGVSGP